MLLPFNAILPSKHLTALFIMPLMEVLSVSETASTGGDGGLAIPRPTVTPQTQTSDVDWQTIENGSDFRELVREKRNFIIPATIFFLIYYFGFLVLVGYFPSVVEVNVIGNINFAYLIALSEFVMAWIIVYLYVRRARLFDKLANAILTKVKGGGQ